MTSQLSTSLHRTTFHVGVIYQWGMGLRPSSLLTWLLVQGIHMRRLPRCSSAGLLLTYEGCSSGRLVDETADITSFAGGEAQAFHPEVETCSSTMLVISGSKSACFERGHRRVDKNTSSDTFKWCSYDDSLFDFSARSTIYR